MLPSHDAVGAQEPLQEAGLNSVYNPDEIPGMFAKVHSLLSTPASVTAAGPAAPGRGCTFGAGLLTLWSLLMQMNSQIHAN